MASPRWWLLGTSLTALIACAVAPVVGLLTLLLLGPLLGSWGTAIAYALTGAGVVAIIARVQSFASGWRRAEPRGWVKASALGGAFLGHTVVLWLLRFLPGDEALLDRLWFGALTGAAGGIGYGAATGLTLRRYLFTREAPEQAPAASGRRLPRPRWPRLDTVATAALLALPTLMLYWGWSDYGRPARQAGAAVGRLAPGMPTDVALRLLAAAPGMVRRVDCPVREAGDPSFYVFYYGGPDLGRGRPVWLETDGPADRRRVIRYALSDDALPCK
jgi:hypothetical protein